MVRRTVRPRPGARAHRPSRRTQPAREGAAPAGAAGHEERRERDLPTRLGAPVGSTSPAASTTSVRILRPRLVHLHRAAAERLLVKLFDGHLRFRVGAHLDERKPPSLPRELVAGHEHRSHRTRLREQLFELRLLHLVREIPDVQPAAHVTLLTRALDSRRTDPTGARRRKETGEWAYSSLRPN